MRRCTDNAFGEAVTVPILFDNGSGCGWMKESLVKQLIIRCFPSNDPASLSGVGAGARTVSHDTTIKVGLLHTDGDTTWLETTVGVISDSTKIPSELLLGKAVHERLQLVSLGFDRLQLLQVPNHPTLDPIADLAVYTVSSPVKDTSDHKLPSELTDWKDKYPTVFDTGTQQTTPIDDHGVRHIITTSNPAPITLPGRPYSPA